MSDNIDPAKTFSLDHVIPIRNSSIHNDTNERIYDRNIPNAPLQPYLNCRPVQTKYATFPVVDPRAPFTEPLVIRPTYNTSRNFYGGDRNAPWSGFTERVNTESELRNQIYALQKSSAAVYVPSESSDLYIQQQQQSNDNGLKKIQQPFGLLFKDPSVATAFNPSPFPKNRNNNNMFNFNEATRVEIKNLNPY